MEHPDSALLSTNHTGLANGALPQGAFAGRCACSPGPALYCCHTMHCINGGGLRFFCPFLLFSLFSYLPCLRVCDTDWLMTSSRMCACIPAPRTIHTCLVGYEMVIGISASAYLPIYSRRRHNQWSLATIKSNITTTYVAPLAPVVKPEYQRGCPLPGPSVRLNAAISTGHSTLSNVSATDLGFEVTG